MTDNTVDHVAVSGWTMPRLAQALLDDASIVGRQPSGREVSDQLGILAIRSVIPKDVPISIDKVIEIRRRYGNDLASFRAHLEELGASLGALGTIDDPGALQAHLEATYQDTLRRDLRQLKEDLKALQVDTVMAVMNIRVALPIAATSLAELAHAPLPVSPVIAGGGAIAFGLAQVLRSKREQARERTRSSPAAYLLYIQDRLQPNTLVRRVQRQTKKCLLGVPGSGGLPKIS